MKRMLISMAVVAVSAVCAAQSKPALRSEMLVSTQWLAEHLKDPGVIVLSVGGSPGFYSEGHIPGARFINLDQITVKRGDVPNELAPVDQLQKVFRDAGVTNASRVVIYGDRYNLLAARAYYTLDYLGIAEHAALLDGGLSKWKNELRPLTNDVPAVKAGTLTVKVNSKILVDTAEMKKLSESKSPALIDARPLEEYSGERRSEDVSKLGHIPGASHLYWMDLLVSRENPVLLSPEELRKKFETANANVKVVTYCRTGMQSSFDYFVAKYLGYDASMYDASFFEWSAEDLPAEVSAKVKP
ncbi:MAG: Thiosulfate sulfurtransferase [Acidobacteriales bacterium]|nr:Thiosulfate sulfurtransferase [Terriglobales bacterium]